MQVFFIFKTAIVEELFLKSQDLPSVYVNQNCKMTIYRINFPLLTLLYFLLLCLFL